MSLKAVILAGGKGTRLAPLTQTVPKPLLPVAGEAAVRHIISLLCENGVDECVLTLCFLPEAIKNELGGCCNGVELKYYIEDEPLGTAGGVKAAIGLLSEPCGDIIVISGDCICDININSAYEFHRSKNAEVTVLTKRHTDPTSYGVVSSEADGRIKRFIEKPSRNRMFSDAVNTGIYILSENAVGLIPENTSCDFASDLFPHMLTEKRALYSFECEGDWCDIGTLWDYRRCNTDALRGKYSLPYPPKAPRGCYLTSCGANVTVGENSQVVASVLLDGAKIGDRCKITAAIIGENTVVGDGTVIHCGAVVGHGCVIDENSELKEDCVIGNFENIGGKNKLKLKNGALFSPDGFSLGKAPSPSPLFSLGSAAACTLDAVGICHDGQEASAAAAKAFAFGVVCAGKDAYMLGKCVKTEARAANRFFRFELTAYFYGSGGEYRVVFYDINGLCPTKDIESEVIKTFNTQSDTFALPTGKLIEINELERLYTASILSAVRSCPLDGISVDVGGNEAERLGELLKRAGAEVKYGKGGAEDIGICVENGGESIGIRFENGRIAEKYEVIAMLLSLDKPSKLALPHDTPPLVTSTAEKHGFDVGYYLLTDKGTSENVRNRELFYTHPYTEDMLYACVLLLGLLKKSGREAGEILNEAGNVYIKVENYSVDDLNKAKIMRELYEENADRDEYADGVRVKGNECEAGVTCSSTGLRAVIQAKNAEAANEFSTELKRKISRLT